MKGVDVGANITGTFAVIGNWLVHAWPTVAAATAASALFLRCRRWFVHAFAVGVDRAKLERDLDGLQDQYILSERARTSLRTLLDDLSTDYDRLADDLEDARRRLTEAGAMLEIRSANEWMLFGDREKALAWGNDCAARLRANGDTAPVQPEMLGVPVAEPDEVITERFHRDREDLIRRYEQPLARRPDHTRR